MGKKGEYVIWVEVREWQREEVRPEAKQNLLMRALKSTMGELMKGQDIHIYT